MNKSKAWKKKNQELIKYLSQAIGPDDLKRGTLIEIRQ